MDQAPEALLLRSDAAGVATLTLNRPQHYNALSLALLDALHDAISRIARDDTVRVVVLAGAGKAFCAGHDLKELRSARDRAYAESVFRRCSEVMLALNRMPQPVIARVHGIAAAAGCQLVAQCDLAVSTTVARYATSGINVGLFCATPAVPLSRNVPRKQAMEMLLTGEFIDAQSALRHGLVNRVVEPSALDEEISRLTAAIVAKPAASIAAGKRAFYEQLHDGLDAAYAAATETMVCNLLTDEVAEGIDAFLEKRKPRWTAS
ncbi:MAG TPA: enoyl-CoA hydratase [Burkholderiales bacterium]|nr:enoyl-CoA hydratase [Burkholderiales bacterium]